MKLQYVLTFDVRDQTKDVDDLSLTTLPDDKDMHEWVRHRLGRDRETNALGENNWLAGLTIIPVKPL